MLRTTGAYPTTLTGGRNGFADENPPTVPLGTQLNAQWHNDVQENLAAAIEGAGITLSDSDSIGGNGQLLQAIRRLGAGGYTLITSSGALTADMSGRVVVDCSAGNITLTLPAAAAMNGSYAGGAATSNNPVIFSIYRRDSSGNTLTVQRAGTDGITLTTLTLTSFQIGPVMQCELFSDCVSSWQLLVQPVSPGPAQWQEWSFAGTYSFIVPPGKTDLRFTGCGAGGGGGGTTTTGDAGVAGAGSPMAVFLYNATPGTTLTIVVGGGGTAGVGGATPAAGTMGGTSQILVGGVTLAQVTGGAGGAASSGAGIATTSNVAGAASAPNSQLVSTMSASTGAFGLQLGSVTLNAQPGSPWNQAQRLLYSTAPPPPLAPGNGGWGGINGGPGGAGSPGYWRIEY